MSGNDDVDQADADMNEQPPGLNPQVPAAAAPEADPQQLEPGAVQQEEAIHLGNMFYLDHEGYCSGLKVIDVMSNENEEVGIANAENNIPFNSRIPCAHDESLLFLEPSIFKKEIVGDIRKPDTNLMYLHSEEELLKAFNDYQWINSSFFNDGMQAQLSEAIELHEISSYEPVSDVGKELKFYCRKERETCAKVRDGLISCFGKVVEVLAKAKVLMGIYVTGSLVQGTFGVDSDVDCTVISVNPNCVNIVYKLLQEAADVLRFSVKKSEIPNNNFTLVQVDFKSSGYHVDLSFGSLAAVYSNFLINSVGNRYAPFKDLSLFLKEFYSTHGLKKYIKSYGTFMTEKFILLRHGITQLTIGGKDTYLRPNNLFQLEVYGLRTFDGAINIDSAVIISEYFKAFGKILDFETDIISIGSLEVKKKAAKESIFIEEVFSKENYVRVYTSKVDPIGEADATYFYKRFTGVMYRTYQQVQDVNFKLEKLLEPYTEERIQTGFIERKNSPTTIKPPSKRGKTQA